MPSGQQITSMVSLQYKGLINIWQVEMCIMGNASIGNLNPQQ